jgi:GT2 family glycosyltransferase
VAVCPESSVPSATSPSTPVLSVVVPTCNRPELLHLCLEAVTRSIVVAGVPQVEIIVTDDSGDDRTRDLIASTYPQTRWVRGPRRGPAANRNAGTAAARGCWILFTDDDCLPAPGWLQAYLGAMQANPQCNVFEGKTIADRNRHRLDEDSPVNETGGYLWSCNVAIRRELFEQLGGFCESFPYAAMEDVDLRLRLLERNEKFPFVADAVICHPYRSSKGVGFAVKTGRSYLHLIGRHPSLLGVAPWRTCALTCARRVKQFLVDGVRHRFRGGAYAVACLFVVIYFEIAARLRREAKSLERAAPQRQI